MPSTTMRTAVLFLLWSQHVSVSGFYLSSKRTTFAFTSCHGVVSFNDFSGETIGDATSEEGQELAQEFYEQLRRRSEDEQEKRRQLERLEQALRYGPRRPQQQQPQQQRQASPSPPRVRQDVLDFEKEFRKWTGQADEDEVTTSSTSAGFFRGGSSVYSFPAAGTSTSMNAAAYSAASGGGAGAAQAMEDDDENVLERAMLGVLPYLLALAVVVSLAMGSGALETSSEYDVFQDSVTTTTTTTTTSGGVTATTLTAFAPFPTAESSLQQHMDQVLLRKNCVML